MASTATAGRGGLLLLGSGECPDCPPQTFSDTTQQAGKVTKQTPAPPHAGTVPSSHKDELMKCTADCMHLRGIRVSERSLTREVTQSTIPFISHPKRQNNRDRNRSVEGKRQIRRGVEQLGGGRVLLYLRLLVAAPLSAHQNSQSQTPKRETVPYVNLRSTIACQPKRHLCGS